MNNNFNLIRLIAASQVLLVHFFNHFSIEHQLISIIKLFPGVPIFFFISGLMIFQSYERSIKNTKTSFYKKRFLRIYPALWGCLILTTSILFIVRYLNYETIILKDFIIWLLAQGSIFQFYNPDFMRDFGIGVFNGSLWTISIELQFYIIMPLIFKIIQKSTPLTLIILSISIIANFYIIQISTKETLADKLLYVSFLPWIFIFIFGCIVAKYKNIRDSIKNQNTSIIFILFIVSMITIGNIEENSSNGINVISILMLSCLTYKVGLNSTLAKTKISSWTNTTDISYGVYLYHMPIINSLIFLSIFSTIHNLIITLCVSFILSIFSWYVIEKPALAFKRN